MFFPHAIMRRRLQSSLDYPRLKAGHAIADSICWLVMPDLFSKDSRQASPELRYADITATGLTTQRTDGGAKWPLPSTVAQRIAGGNSYSVIWRGNLEALTSHGALFTIPWYADTWDVPYGLIRFARDASQARLCTTFAKSSSSFDSGNYADDNSLLLGQHLYAVTYDGATISFWRDGTHIGSTSDSSFLAASGWDSSTGIILNVNQFHYGEGIQASDVDLCLLADRALSGSEIASINADRMQLIG